MGSEVSYTALVSGAKEGEALQAIAGDEDDTVYEEVEDDKQQELDEAGGSRGAVVDMRLEHVPNENYRDFVTHKIRKKESSLDNFISLASSGSKPVDLPMEKNHKFSLARGKLVEDVEKYKRLVGTVDICRCH
ncbi:unnamed protein product [Citrullus colocynthis]|uniref:Uncharacterized protein n=1 Tax=Citrullus colocynthis TaxID=252529 RepID=A0ABP0Y5J3_9ROSI